LRKKLVNQGMIAKKHFVSYILRLESKT